MVLVTIRGIPVDFPYEPYGPQVVYMTRVLDALSTGNNALLESPTGTGKTLCLLCAALAWRQTFVASLQAAVRGVEGGGEAGAAAGKGGGDAAGIESLFSKTDGQGAVPRIVYSSRTHSQLAQAVRELKKTIYSPKMTVLGSRAQLCIHPEVSQLGEVEQSYRCRALTNPSKRGCRHYLAVRSNRPHENRSEELIERLLTEGPRDIEDLAGFGRDNHACPYYLSRAVQGECEIVFVPYNYLLDKNARATLEVNWANDIIILDEAHNLESICSSAMSFDLSASIRRACCDELTKSCEGAIASGGVTFPVLARIAAGSAAGEASVIGSENKDMQEFRILRTIMLDLEDTINDLPVPEKKPLVRPGDFLRAMFVKSAGLNAENQDLVLDALDRSIKAIVGEEPGSSEQAAKSESGRARGTPLRTLQSAIRILFSPQAVSSSNSFRTIIHFDKGHPPQRTVSYWCFNPALGMAGLRSLNIRCVLLTSGTLAPLRSFAGELGMPFPVQLENPHVVTERQILGCVIKTGPGGIGLNASFKNRSSSDYINELGRTLVNLFRVIPGGVLIFFPSYSSLHSMIEAWKQVDLSQLTNSPSLWVQLQRRKCTVVEPRDSSRFAAAILAHQMNVREGKGSALFAVCRGKVSEGIDFSDDYGRAVILTGIPYPSAKDHKVVLKREYMDEEARKKKTTGAINGNEWYTLQALRAVNQALGRVIRHKRDYGAVLLLDERFSSAQSISGLSKWIRPSIKTKETFAEAQAVVGRFFREMQKSEFSKAGSTSSIIGVRPRDESDAATDDAKVAEARQAVETLYRLGTSNVNIAEEMARIVAQLKEHQREHKRLCQKSSDDGLRGVLAPSKSTDTNDVGAYGETQKMSTALLANHSSLRRSQAKDIEQGKRRGNTIAKELAGVFEKKDKRRECFGTLRIVVAISKRINEEKSEKNAGQTAQDLKEGFNAVDKLVNLVVDAGGSVDLLRRVRIPRIFQERYDASIRKRMGFG